LHSGARGAGRPRRTSSAASRKHTILYDDNDVERVLLAGVQHRWVDENAPVRPSPIRDGVPPPPAGAPAHAPIKTAAVAAGAAGPARAAGAAGGSGGGCAPSLADATAARPAPGEPDARRAAQHMGPRERAAKVRRSPATECLLVCQGRGLCRLWMLVVAARPQRVIKECAATVRMRRCAACGEGQAQLCLICYAGRRRMRRRTAWQRLAAAAACWAAARVLALRCAPPAHELGL